MGNLLVAVLSFLILILTLYATANIFQSIWFRFWSSRHMNDRQKREFYVENKYDIKWTFCMTVISLLGFTLFQLIGLKDQSRWLLLHAFLWGLFLWGSCRTFNIEKERLNRKKDFGI